MKYMVLIYTNPTTWGHPAFLHAEATAGLPQADRDEMSEQFDTLMKELHSTGEFVWAEPLADPGMTRTIRVRDGATLATDGPFAEAKEQLAGFFILDCATPERVEEVAARWPDARFGAIEVRPIMNLGGQEM